MEGAFEADGLSCFLHRASYAGASEGEVQLPRHLFICHLEGRFDETVEETWDGRRAAPYRVSGDDYALLVPKGRRFTAKTRGSTSHRYIVCEVGESAFRQVLGEDAGDLELEPYQGKTLLAPGLAKRLESLCLAPDAYPRIYGESVASVFVLELFRTHGAKASLPDAPASAGSVRFDIVVDFIEDHVGSDIGLFELAALTGLNATSFSRAFKGAFGMPVHRYILKRRMERAKSLLRSTDDTVAAIGARVGIPSESRFLQIFARFTHSTPSEYRKAPSP